MLNQLETFIKSLCKNPKYYDFISVNSFEDVLQIVSDLCIKSIVNLSKNHIVIYDEVTEKVTPKLEAFVMVRNYVKFKTMTEIMSFPINASKIQLLLGLSKCEELEKIVRRHEKRFLNDIANKQIKFPIKGKVQLPDQKAYVLLQTGIERITISDYTLRLECFDIVEKSIRLLAAIIELSHNKLYGECLESATILDRTLRNRLWDENYNTVYFQCPNISDKTMKSLNEAGIKNFHDLIGSSVTEIQRRSGCNNIEANNIRVFTLIALKAKLNVFLSIEQHNKLVMKVFRLHEDSEINFSSIENLNISFFPSYQIICYHKPTSLLLYHRKLVYFKTEPSCTFVVSINSEYMLADIKCALISSLVGLDSNINKAISNNQTNKRIRHLLTKSQSVKSNPVVEEVKSNPNDTIHKCFDNSINEFGYYRYSPSSSDKDSDFKEPRKRKTKVDMTEKGHVNISIQTGLKSDSSAYQVNDGLNLNKNFLSENTIHPKYSNVHLLKMNSIVPGLSSVMKRKSNHPSIMISRSEIDYINKDPYEVTSDSFFDIDYNEQIQEPNYNNSELTIFKGTDEKKSTNGTSEIDSQEQRFLKGFL